LWLLFLIKNNPVYKDVIIDEERLSSLPDEDCVAGRINTQIEEDITFKGEEAIGKVVENACDDGVNHKGNEEGITEIEGSQEDTHLGPDQGGAAGEEGHADKPAVMEHFLFTPPDKAHGNSTVPSEENVLREMLEEKKY
jgi:hypothetical protein